MKPETKFWYELSLSGIEIVAGLAMIYFGATSQGLLAAGEIVLGTIIVLQGVRGLGKSAALWMGE